MESEIAAKIPRYSGASLHVHNTENVLHKKNEVLKENYLKKDENCDVVDASGQIVPSQDSEANICSASHSNKKASENNGLSTAPQVNFDAMDNSVEEAEHVFKESETSQESSPIQGGSTPGLEQFISPQNTGCESKNHEHIKTFLWPPIGFKDQVIEQAAPRRPDTFDQVVSNTNKENDDIEITIKKQLTTSSPHYVNESETISSQQENKNLTSILKKDDNQSKKKIQVHFPENIVSVKFYDISDDEDSDTDTVILSDSEDDDYLIRDQEVPFNTYNDYTNNYCFSSSQTLNFIPQFSFPPVLKIADYQLYENINDEEQIMAIMDDDDGHQQQTLSSVNDLVTNESIPGDSVNDCQDEKITSPIIKRLSENPEKSLEIVELQTPVTKSGIEELEDKLKTNENIGKMMETESDCLVVKEDVTSREIIEENFERTLVMFINASTFESDTEDAIAEENTLQHTLRCENPYINKPTACDNHSNASNNNSVFLTTKPAMNMECNTKRDESLDDRMDATPASSNSSTRIFRGNCGSSFMWHGPRTINSMELHEDFQVSLVPAVDNDIIYRRSLGNVVKEDITFPKVGMVDVGSRELNILTALRNERILTTYCHEDFQHRYAIDSLFSFPDHLSELEETRWDSAMETDIQEDIKKLKTNLRNDGLRNDCLKSGNAKSEIYEDQGMKPLCKTTNFTNDNKSVTPDYYKEYHTANCNEKQQEDDCLHLASQIVPDMDVKGRLKTKLLEDSARAVPSGVDDIMDAANTSLHLTDYPLQSHKAMEPSMSHDVQQTVCSNNELEKEEKKALSHTSVFKQTLDFPHSQTLYLTKQGRLKLRVGLSKSTRVKPLHPYWSKERFK